MAGLEKSKNHDIHTGNTFRLPGQDLHRGRRSSLRPASNASLNDGTHPKISHSLSLYQLQNSSRTTTSGGGLGTGDLPLLRSPPRHNLHLTNVYWYSIFPLLAAKPSRSRRPITRDSQNRRHTNATPEVGGIHVHLRILPSTSSKPFHACRSFNPLPGKRTCHDRRQIEPSFDYLGHHIVLLRIQK